MMPLMYLILGDGPAGFYAAKAIRERDEAGDILMISQERMYPYNRPMLTKALEQSLPENKLLIKNKEWYQTSRVELDTGVKATRIDRENKVVYLDDGSLVTYDKLIYALGARNHRPDFPGAGLPHVFSIRTVDDADALRQSLPGVRHAVIIGGGVLGLEAAWSLRRAQVEVQIVEFLPRLMARQLDEEASAALQRVVEGKGVQVRCGAKVSAIQPNCVVLEGGVQLPADLVIISAGVIPNSELAREAGLSVDRGVLVDAQLRTSDPDIYAAGDCVQIPGVLSGIWAQAVRMGECAGMNAAGAGQPFQARTTAMTLQAFDSSVFAVGDNGYDPKRQYKALRRQTAQGKEETLYFSEGKLTGVIVLGDLKRIGNYTKAVEEGREEARMLEEPQA